MNKRQVEQVRRFNRIVTQHVGALQDSYLQRGRPLGQARLLHEVDSDSIDVRLLRERLKLDSGYLSRLLRSLEAQRLVRTDAQASDGRVRRVVLTPKGHAERATYDALSDELAMSLLKRLDPAQRDRLVSAMAEVERLLRAGAVELRPEAPNSAAAVVPPAVLRGACRALRGRLRPGPEQLGQPRGDDAACRVLRHCLA
jgi:DNA-binding MarR family transcriptional regulator